MNKSIWDILFDECICLGIELLAIIFAWNVMFQGSIDLNDGRVDKIQAVLLSLIAITAWLGCSNSSVLRIRKFLKNSKFAPSSYHPEVWKELKKMKKSIWPGILCEFVSLVLETFGILFIWDVLFRISTALNGGHIDKVLVVVLCLVGLVCAIWNILDSIRLIRRILKDGKP